MSSATSLNQSSYSSDTKKALYKRHCFICDETINRGDDIARCMDKSAETNSISTRATKTGQWVHSVCKTTQLEEPVVVVEAPVEEPVEEVSMCSLQ